MLDCARFYDLFSSVSLCLCDSVVNRFLLLLAMRKPLVQHEVYDDTRDRNIHPKRPGPTRNRAMCRVTSPEAPAQRDDHHGHNDDRQDYMRHKDQKIDRMPHSFTEKTDFSDVGVKVEIASEKQSRRNDCRDHARAMCGELSANDQPAPNQQQHGARRVQTRNQSREERELFRDRISDDQAAGLVLRRFTIRNANPNMTNENRSRVATAEGSGNVVSAPG